MWFWLAANVLLLIHLSFVIYVLLGGLLVVRWKWSALLHLPSVAWGVLVEYRGWVCPLTPLEQKWRLAAGQKGYSGGFIEHYLLPLLYPADLTRELQLLLGTGALLLNLIIYTAVAVLLLQKKR